MTCPAHEMIESTDGVRIALYDLGGPSGMTTPVLLFSHATGLNGRVWEPMASFLSDRFRCISLDLRGHGLSELPPGAGLAWSGMADDVLAALDSDHLRAGPLNGVGHSMGGAALVLAAAARPGAFRSLWLYEPVIVPPTEQALFGGENPMSEAAARHARSSTRETRRTRTIDRSLHSTSCTPMPCGPTSTAASLRPGTAPSPCGVFPPPRRRCSVGPRPAVHGRASAHAIPVAVVVGRPEAMGPAAFAPATAAALSRGTLIERPQLGHFGPLEDPQAMAADVADWVGRISP